MPTIESPSTTMSPLSGLSNPMIVFSSTDLPVPDGPRIAVIHPLGTSKPMSSSTLWLPNDFATCDRVIIGSSVAVRPAPWSTSSTASASASRSPSSCLRARRLISITSAPRAGAWAAAVRLRGVSTRLTLPRHAHYLCLLSPSISRIANQTSGK